MGSGKVGGVPGVLRDIWDAACFGVHLGLSCSAVRQQFFELLRRDAPRPAARIGVAANVLDGAAGRQAVFVTMESAPRPNPGLWMRIDIFGRDGYRQTFYPFWRSAEVFHDFLAVCADIAEAPARPDGEADQGVAGEEGEEAFGGPAAGGVTRTLEPGFGPARRAGAIGPFGRLAEWLAARFRGRGPVPGRTWRPGKVRRSPGARVGAGSPRESVLPQSPQEHSELAIQTTARRGEQIQGQCTLLSFAYLEEVFDHVLLSGHRVAIKVVSEGPDLWAVVWRRADGGLYLRWGGLDHPAGPIYRESPATLFQKLSEYELDLERVWSQARPPAV